jgi:hypothetical protein
MRSAETRREAVVQHSPGESSHKPWNPNVLSEKSQTGRCYGRFEFAVTLLFRRGDAVRSVEASQHRNSPDSGVLLRQKPSEKERGVPIGTAVGRLGREENGVERWCDLECVFCEAVTSCAVCWTGEQWQPERWNRVWLLNL